MGVFGRLFRRREDTSIFGSRAKELLNGGLFPPDEVLEELLMLMGKQPSVGLIMVFMFSKRQMRHYEDGGFSPLEAFWMDFVATCLYVWDGKGPKEYAVPLSEIFELYSAVHSSIIGSGNGPQEQTISADSLRDTYHKVRKIVMTDLTMKPLVHLIFDEKGDPLQMVKAIMVLSAVVTEVEVPWKLIEDE